VRNTVIMIVLAILAAATWVATWERQATGPPVETSTDDRPLGYYMRGTRLLVTDEQGRVVYRLNAERLDEVPNEAKLRLEGVTVAYEPADETAWDMSAVSASAPKDGSLLELEGNVEVRSAPTDGSRPVTISTQKLALQPNTSSVESNEPVEIRVGDWQLRATGFRTDLKGHTLRLESQVHGIFAPQ
jgi:LPS export ABC transporter protein LptC